jgi:hypothetical protein
MVLGLGVTRILLGFITVFRIRRESPVDWVPLTWASILFVLQLQYWWAITQLPSVKPTFSFLDFVFLVVLTLMLYLSAALMLPNRNDDEKEELRVYFEKDGRYALLALTGYLLLGFFANIFFFNLSPNSNWGLSDIPMIILPVAAFIAKSRRVYAALTIVYVPLAAWDIWIS